MTLDNKSVSVREGALHGHYHWYTDDAQGEHHLMLAFCEKKETAMKFENQTPFHMKHVGGNVYRNYNRSQILVFQNMYKDVGEPESQEPDFGKHDGFRCANSFVYMHPGSPESTLRIGFDKHGECKVSWQGGKPTGWWNVNELEPGTRVPSGTDGTAPVFSVRFNWKGEETQESGTVYGLLLGTWHVYRAIGSVDKNGQVCFYTDDELDSCKPWHIVLVSRSKACAPGYKQTSHWTSKQTLCVRHLTSMIF